MIHFVKLAGCGYNNATCKYLVKTRWANNDLLYEIVFICSNQFYGDLVLRDLEALNGFTIRDLLQLYNCGIRSVSLDKWIYGNSVVSIRHPEFYKIMDKTLIV